MKASRKLFNLSLVSALAVSGLTAPLVSAEEEAGENIRIAMITEPESPETDTFLADVRIGLENFAKSHDIEEGPEGYEILSTQSEASYHSQLKKTTEGDYDLIIAVGADRQIAVEEFAKENTDQEFVMVDARVDLDNVKSMTFKDHEAAFLAGLAAASETKTNKVGFIGGMDVSTIQAFETGFRAGIEEVSEGIELETAYLSSFDEINEAHQLASDMYESGCDIIYHAAGRAGDGVFAAARDQVTLGNDEIWVIGADQDQTGKGEFEFEGEKYSLTLTSSLKKVDKALEAVLCDIADNGFTNETVNYGVDGGNVDISRGQLSGETLDLVDDYRTQLIEGKLNLDNLVEETE